MTREITRLNINVSRETAEQLQRLAREHGMTMTEVIRRAVSVYGFVHAEIQDGHEVTTGTGRKRRQLVLL